MLQSFSCRVGEAGPAYILNSLMGHHCRHSECVKANAKRVSGKKELRQPKEKLKTFSEGRVTTQGSTLSQSNLGFEDVHSALLSSEGKNLPKDKDLSEMNGPLIQSKREAVLQACVGTCGGIFVAGVVIQQAAHWAAEAGWPVPDSTLLYHVEVWHLGVVLGLVVVISSARQFLLQVWHDFSESTNVANKQVLGPLKPSDYLTVAVLSGISEELLFRGALLPLIGLDWKGATLAGIFFGALHLNGGRNMAFAVWASFVGILYGFACLYTHSVIVPMVAHLLNNLVGATLWKMNEESQYLGPP